MRLSVDSRSPYFMPLLLPKARVFVDDVEVTSRCSEASEEEGWADCLVLDGSGLALIGADHTFARERLTGRVEIRVPMSRRAVIPIDVELLSQMLDLPDGIRVWGIDGVAKLLVVGERCPEVPAWAEPPTITPVYESVEVGKAHLLRIDGLDT